MATKMQRRRRPRYFSKDMGDPRPEAAAEDQPEKKPKRRRWRLRFFIAGVVMMAILWLLPGIIAHTPLFSMILASATSDLDGELAVDSASLGWFSPIELSGVTLSDSQSKPAVEVEKVSSGQPLLAILTSMPNFGTFRIENPKLHVVLEDGSSNLETILAEYLKPSEEPTSPMGMKLEIVDGSANIEDKDSGRSWQIDNLQLAMSMSADESQPLELAASAVVVGTRTEGDLDAKLSFLADATGKSAIGSGEVYLKANNLPMDMLDPLLARFMPGTKLVGNLSSQIEAEWGKGETPSDSDIKGNVSIAGLGLTIPMLGTDRVQMVKVDADWLVNTRADRLQIEKSSIVCDLGALSASGTLDMTSGLDLDGLLSQSLKASGQLDLARLAAMLPETLRIRPETKITAGSVQFAASSGPNERPGAAKSLVWTGGLRVENLQAVDRGRPLVWAQPVKLDVTAYNSQQGPVIESLTCQSDFLNANSAGTLNKMGVAAQFDLGKLAGQLGQFVDLGGLKLAGAGWTNVNFSRGEDKKFSADAELQLRNFELSVPGKRPWTEENLLVFASVAGRTDLGMDTQIDSASAVVKSAPDEITLKLTQPVLDITAGGTWPVQINAHGELARWLPRIEAWMPLEDWYIAGAYTIESKATASLREVSLSETTASIDNLAFRGPGINIAERRAELTVEGKWDQDQRRLTLKPATLSTSTVALRAEDFVLAVPAEGSPEAAGTLKYRADIGRLKKWFASADEKPGWNFAGLLGGEAVVEQSGGKIGGKIEATLENLVVTGASGEKFQEPLITLNAVGSYLHESGDIRLDSATLKSAAVGANLSGTVSTGGEETAMQLAGQMDYDLAKLVALGRQHPSLRPYLDGKVQMAGRGANPMSYAGPLDPATAKANAGFGWDWANLYGFQVGRGVANATLADGVLKLEPMNLDVSGGKMNLAAQMRLSPEPMQLTVPPGKLATNVQVNQKMCDDFMKYVMPVLADVTSADGSFSIELEKCRIPFDDIAKGDLAGRISINTMTIGPGPLIREFSSLLGNIQAGSLRRESVVEFQMVNGRVYHKGLELEFPEFTIRTYGSVGVKDQTLSIMAEMPVPQKWLGNNALSSALRDRVIKVPIGGTLSSPQLDQKVLRQLAEQFTAEAVRGVLENEGGRLLEGLLRGGR